MKEILSRLPENVEFVNMEGNSLTVRIKDGGSIAETGTTLLMLERRLHHEVDSTIEVFLETLADTNILRRRDK